MEAMSNQFLRENAVGNSVQGTGETVNLTAKGVSQTLAGIYLWRPWPGGSQIQIDIAIQAGSGLSKQKMPPQSICTPRTKGCLSGCCWEQGDNLLGIISHISVTVAEARHRQRQAQVFPKGREPSLTAGYPHLNVRKRIKSCSHQLFLFLHALFSCSEYFWELWYVYHHGTGKRP